MSSFQEKIVAALYEHGPLWINELARKARCNKNKLIKEYPKWENQGLISKREEGKKIILVISDQNKNISKFVHSFPNEIKLYQKTINKQLEILKKSKPLVTGLKKIHYRESYLELKKTLVGKPDLELKKSNYVEKTRPAEARTWKIKPKAMKSLNYLFTLLNEMYSRSATFTFVEIDFPDKELIKSYQKTIIKIIKNAIEKLYSDQNDDPTSQLAIKQFIDLNVSTILFHEKLKTESKSLGY
ncbi:MAG: hypothetical protein FJ360_02215 [Thaumarchaeota archaeon]|nr:hypothetical protein [Nitrososphaerota archaeon]